MQAAIRAGNISLKADEGIRRRRCANARQRMPEGSL